MDAPGEQAPARLAVAPGQGWIARRSTSLLFIPAGDDGAARPEAARLVTHFLDHGPDGALISADLPRCILDWSEPSTAVRIDTTIALVEQRSFGGSNGAESRAIRPGLNEVRQQSGHDQVISTTTDTWVETAGDLRAGSAPAGGFALILAASATPRSDAEQAPPTADVTAEPQFDELADLDVTLTPIGPITYPDDDTDRTFRRSGDIRCPRGHANGNTNVTCRVCDEPLDSTADRPGPRASSATAALGLPDGSFIPINRNIAIGRAPTAEGARLVVAPQLVTIEAPGTVSRTHVVVRLDGDVITVTDCGSRGRTAVLPDGHATPDALEPWTPRTVAIGDTIQLGGPTTLMIADPAELRIPASLEPTAIPPEQNEIT